MVFELIFFVLINQTVSQISFFIILNFFWMSFANVFIFFTLLWGWTILPHTKIRFRLYWYIVISFLCCYFLLIFKFLIERSFDWNLTFNLLIFFFHPKITKSYYHRVIKSFQILFRARFTLLQHIISSTILM